MSKSVASKAISNTSVNSTQDSYGPKKVSVYLDEIVDRWASYMISKTKEITETEIQIVKNWNKVEILQDNVEFDAAPTINNKEPVSQKLFSTVFVNQTNQEQEFSFKTERKTRQSCTFSFEKTFTIEKELGVSVKLPMDVVEISGGLKSTQEIECGKDQTTEEEISWQVDNMIKVKPKSKVCASLVMSEVKLERNFKLNTYLRGRLVVTILNIQDNNKFLRSLSADIDEIIKLALERNWIPNDACKFEVTRDNNSNLVKCNLKGKCKFRLGVAQNVTLDEMPLSKETNI